MRMSILLVGAFRAGGCLRIPYRYSFVQGMMAEPAAARFAIP